MQIYTYTHVHNNPFIVRYKTPTWLWHQIRPMKLRNRKLILKLVTTLKQLWVNIGTMYVSGVISRIDKTTDTCSINFDDGEKRDAIMLTHVRLVKKNRAAKNKIEMPKNLSILKINKKKAALIKAFNF